MAAKKAKAAKPDTGGTLLADPPQSSPAATAPAPKANTSTHVAIEVRLTTTDAVNLKYVLGRLEGLVDREIVTMPKGYDQFEALSAIRKVVERLG
jgi:hypothetical protein